MMWAVPAAKPIGVFLEFVPTYAYDLAFGLVAS